jgi:hypothetical protein
MSIASVETIILGIVYIRTLGWDDKGSLPT